MKLPNLPNNFAIGLCTKGLRLYGFWTPEFGDNEYWKKLFYGIYAFAMFMFLLGFYLIIQSFDLIIIWGDVDLMIGTIFLLLTNFSNAFKIFNVIYRHKDLVKIIDIALLKKNAAKYPEELKMIQRYERTNFRDVMVFVFFATFCIMGWSMAPILEGNYIGDKRKLPLEAWYPFDKYATPAYELCYAHQMVAILAAAYSNLMNDNLMAALISTASVQLELLMFALKRVSVSKDELIEEEENGVIKTKTQQRSEEELYEELRQFIQYHQEIYDVTENIQKAVNPVAFAQLSVSSVIICVTLYQLSEVSSKGFGPTFGTIMYMGCMVWQVFIYCWHGNELMLNSARLNHAIYESEWYSCSVRYQKTLLPFMIRGMKPIQLTAGWFIKLSLDTFMSILKSAYSFYTVISQANS